MATMTIEVDSFDFSSEDPVITSELVIDDPCYSTYKITVDPNQSSSSSLWLTWENLMNASTSYDVNAYDVTRVSVGGVPSSGFVFVDSGLSVDEISEFNVTMRASVGSSLRTGYLQPSLPVAFKILFKVNFSETSNIVEGATTVDRKGNFPCVLLE